jgi:hypothetical protein
VKARLDPASVLQPAQYPAWWRAGRLGQHSPRLKDSIPTPGCWPPICAAWRDQAQAVRGGPHRQAPSPGRGGEGQAGRHLSIQPLPQAGRYRLNQLKPAGKRPLPCRRLPPTPCSPRPCTAGWCAFSMEDFRAASPTSAGWPSWRNGDQALSCRPTCQPGDKGAPAPHLPPARPQASSRRLHVQFAGRRPSRGRTEAARLLPVPPLPGESWPRPPTIAPSCSARPEYNRWPDAFYEYRTRFRGAPGGRRAVLGRIAAELKASARCCTGRRLAETYKPAPTPRAPGPTDGATT